MPRSSKLSDSPRSFHQNPVCTSPASHTCDMPCFSHSWFDHPNSIWWGVQITKLFFMYSSPLSCYLFPLGPKYLSQHPILEQPHPMFVPVCERPDFTPILNKKHNYGSVYLKYICFWISDWKTKDSTANDSKHSLTSVYFFSAWMKFLFVSTCFLCTKHFISHPVFIRPHLMESTFSSDEELIILDIKVSGNY